MRLPPAVIADYFGHRRVASLVANKFVGWSCCDAAQQVLKELDDLFGLDGLLEHLEIEVPDGESGDRLQQGVYTPANA